MFDFTKYKVLVDMQVLKGEGTAHFDAVLCPAGLYLEYEEDKPFKWYMTIDDQTFEGSTLDELIKLFNEVSAYLSEVKSNKSQAIIVYTYRLKEVSEFFKNQITAGDDNHCCEVVLQNSIILRDCASIAPISCIDELSEDFLKVNTTPSRALALFGKEAFNTFLVNDKQISKIFKTSASKAKYQIGQHLPANHKSWITNLIPNQDIYNFIRYKCFRASLCMTGKKNADEQYTTFTSHLSKNVLSYDQSSAHAHKLVCKDFPISEPVELRNIPEDITKLLQTKWCWMELELENVNNYADTEGLDPFKVRGQKTFTLYCDQIQFRAFNLFYHYDSMTVKCMFIADKGKLPMWARKAIADLYMDKALYPTKDAKRNMLKVILNSGSYGVTVERLYDYWQDEEESIPKTYSNRCWKNTWAKRLLPPQVGVSITSYVFLDECLIIAAEPDAFAYCDTDSVKFESWSTKTLEAIKLRNEESYAEVKAFCEEAGYPYDVMKELGAYQLDAEYKVLKAISAKEYIYMDKDGLYGATTAGYASHYEAKPEWHCKKTRIPVALYEPLSKGADPFVYFTPWRHFKDWKNLWFPKELKIKKGWFDLTVYENATVVNKLEKLYKMKK